MSAAYSASSGFCVYLAVSLTLGNGPIALASEEFMIYRDLQVTQRGAAAVGHTTLGLM